MSLQFKYGVFRLLLLDCKALVASSCFLFLGCRVDWLFLGRFSCGRCLPSLLDCLASSASCFGSSCDAGGLSSSSGSESRFGSGNKFMSSSGFGQYSGVLGARNGVS